MRHSNSVKEMQHHVNATLRTHCAENPLSTVVATFGIAVALGVASRNAIFGALFGRVAKKVVETNGTGLLEKILEGSLTTLLMQAGADLFNDRVQQLAPQRDGGISPAAGQHRPKDKIVN